MTKPNIKKIKQLLEGELEAFRQTENVASSGAQTVELDQSKVGRLSRMDAMQQQAMSMEQIRRAKKKVQLIQAALKRIENDEYGWCLDCDEAINSKRLEISPETPYCFTCADKHLT